MTYSVSQWSDGKFYIRWERGDTPLKADIGPYRFEIDARKKAEQLNASTWISGAPGRNAKQGTLRREGGH